MEKLPRVDLAGCGAARTNVAGEGRSIECSAPGCVRHGPGVSVEKLVVFFVKDRSAACSRRCAGMCRISVLQVRGLLQRCRGNWPGQSHLNLDVKTTHIGHPQGLPLPIVIHFRLRNRSPVAEILRNSRTGVMICIVLGVISELGPNQVVSLGLDPIGCDRPENSTYRDCCEWKLIIWSCPFVRGAVGAAGGRG